MNEYSSSGDVAADRRYEWGAASASRGEDAAAADLFAQTLELAPRWAPAWFALGESLARLGEAARAIDAFGRAAALDTEGALGAGLRLAALGASPPPAAAPPVHVRALFDQYAARFDAHLVETLGYRGPELLRAALEKACAARGREFHFDRAFDLGCGTGLMGKALTPRVHSLVGVDLSPKMIEAARATGCYNHLHAREIVEFLAREHDAGASLALAADVFVYIGDLAEVFAQVARVLEAGGLFAFSAQRGEAGDWSLGADLRYAHSAGYLRRLAATHGFAMALMEETSTRRDAGRDVPGLVCVLAKP